VQKIVIEYQYSLFEITCCVIDNDGKLTSQIECFAYQAKIIGVDDDDKYISAAAAHAAFALTVSAARMYW